MQNKFFYIRQPLEKFIFKLIIGRWNKNIELINRFNSIYKLGKHYLEVMVGYGLTFGLQRHLIFQI